jgi:hypothetical protein
LIKELFCDIVKIIMSSIESSIPSSHAAMPNSAAIGQKLAEMRLIDMACELTPALTSVPQGSFNAEVPLEYDLSNNAVNVPETDWRTSNMYPRIVALQLSQTIMKAETSGTDADYRLSRAIAASDLTDQTMDLTPTNQSEAHIALVARRDGLRRMQLLTSNGQLPDSVIGAYAYGRKDIDEPLDVSIRPLVPRIEAARASYLNHALRSFSTKPYDYIQAHAHEGTIEINDSEQTYAGLWLRQVGRDLACFRTSII